MSASVNACDPPLMHRTHTTCIAQRHCCRTSCHADARCRYWHGHASRLMRDAALPCRVAPRPCLAVLETNSGRLLNLELEVLLCCSMLAGPPFGEGELLPAWSLAT